MGWRQILSHNWTVTSKDGFSFSKDGDSKPSIVRVVLPWQWEYTLQVTTLDNENNKLVEKYFLVVSDPVAIIKQHPEKWTTSTTFSFDGAPSYSIVSALKLFTRELFDQAGIKIDTIQGQSIKQNFLKPGFYTVKLTVEDQLGQTNVDTRQVFVSSTDPLPQFLITPTASWKNPSEFTLDASVSADIDKTKWYDTLSYEWQFVDNGKAKIISTQNNNEKVVVQFDAVGKHAIKLVAKDDYGKIAEITKDIEILSSLRPVISVSPLATSWWNPMVFSVMSNLPISHYEWDFGDGDTRTIQSESVTHTYTRAWVYKVVLKVNAADWTTNEVSVSVFVGEKNAPVAWYIVKDKAWTLLTQNDVCMETVDGQQQSVPAYHIQRYQDFVLDPSLSVNTKGQKTALQYYFQPKDGEIFKQNIFSYKFNELGCTYVDLTVEDTSLSKNSRVRVWFKSINGLPVLDNLILGFPQYGNEIWVGFKENNAKDIFNDTFDPLIVKVMAMNPKDPDGFISYFKRYYAYKNDPERYLEMKITPGTIPYAFFSLPRVPGEFVFGVTMYDNDGGKQTNQQVVGNGPIVFFPPDVTRPDIPMVTLKSSQSTVEIGDEITFDVVSSIVSDRPDFIQERTIQYDFDGDGEWDLTTKSDRVKHVYTKPSELWYKPRAAVVYRWYKGVGNGGSIVVKDALKPMLLSDSFDSLAIFRDVSIGNITTKSICLSLKDCKKDATYIIQTGTAFTFTYPRYEKYYVSMDVMDSYANSANKKWVISLQTWQIVQDFHILSIPKASSSARGIEFFVGKNLNNSILFYVMSKVWSCFVDTNIAVDSDKDGNPQQDKDFLCNALSLQSYPSTQALFTWKIYYTSDATQQFSSKEFTVSLLDFQSALPADIQDVADKLTQLLSSLSTSTGDYENFTLLLRQLKDGLLDTIATKSNVVALKDYQQQHPLYLNTDQTELLTFVYNRLTDASIIAAEWGSIYQTAKAEILGTLPTNLKVDVQALFNDFETVVSENGSNISQQDKRKAALQAIIDLIKKNLAPDSKNIWSNRVDPLDMDEIILPNICTIMSFYSLVSPLCPNDTTKIVDSSVAVTDTASGSSSWIRIVLWVLGIWVGIFVLLIWVFAIRAKIRQAQEDESDDIAPPSA
jgi:PKD repeat protein